jgi:hypothetical protein
VSRPDWNAVRFDPGSAAGHVESYFLKANDASGGSAVWLKATILARAGADPVAEAWAIAFRRDGEHVAVKQTVPFRQARFSGERFDVAVAGLELSDGRARGAVESGGHRIEVDLAYTTDAPPLVPFPSLRMYETKLPSSKLVSPHPDSRFTGRLRIDGAELAVEGWRGMQGHNWGRGHAESYGWGHCNCWEGEPELVFEGVTASVKVGPLETPPLTLLVVWHRGVRYELNDPRSLLGARGKVTPRSWRFSAESRLARIEGELAAEQRDVVGLYYENPNGEMTYCLNSKIARGRLRLEVKGRPPLEARTRMAALEVGTKDPAHGVRMYV